MRRGLYCAAFTLLVLKLAGAIDISWLAVLSPAIFVAAIVAVPWASLRSVVLWDKYMGWFPRLPLFWFDSPRWTVPKMTVFCALLMAVFLFQGWPG